MSLMNMNGGLMIAATECSAENIRSLIRAGANVQTRDESGENGLDIAGGGTGVQPSLSWITASLARTERRVSNKVTRIKSSMIN